MTFQEAYLVFYDSFTRLRNLDENDDYWPEEDKLAFKSGYQNLLIAFNREPI